MSTDPEPYYCVIGVHTQSAVVNANPDGMKAAYALEVKRGMSGITFEQLKMAIRKLSYYQW